MTTSRITCWLRNLLPPFPEGHEVVASSSIWVFIGQYLRPATAYLLLLCLLSLAAALVEAGLMRAIGVAVDQLGQSGRRYVPPAMVLIGVALIAAAPALRAASGVLSSYVLAPNLEARSIWRANEALLSSRLAGFDEALPGRIAERVSEVGASIRSLAVQALDTLAFGITYGLTTFLLLSGMSGAFAPALLVWFALYAMLVRRFIPRAADAGARAAAARSAMVGRLADTYAGILAVKLFNAVDSERALARRHVGERLERLFLNEALRTHYDITLALANAALMVAIASIGLGQWQAGSLTLGETTAALALAFRLSTMAGWFLASVSGLADTLGVIRDGIASVAQPREEADPPRSPPIRITRGGIDFRDVEVMRRADGALLGPFALSIAPGEKVGLRGPSGCGKTTLVHALLRLQEIHAGRILIDGQDIAHHSIASLRDQIAVAPQHVRLFHRSLRENLTYSCPNPPAEALERAIDICGLRSLLMVGHGRVGPRYLDEDAGEDGVKLSGGERQRISLARAVLKAIVRRCPIVLLDEPTSSLDQDTAQVIMEELFMLPWQPTLLVISHQPEVLQRLDRVVDLIPCGPGSTNP